MNIALIILVSNLVIWILYKLLKSGKDKDNQGYNRTLNNYDRGNGKEKRNLFSKQESVKPQIKVVDPIFFAHLFSKPLPFDDEAITWCANFFAVDKNKLIDLLRNISANYSYFELSKRSGGVRVISAPDVALKIIQKTINKRILASGTIHPAATGFRSCMCITDNASVHLGKGQVLKIDIANFFGMIKKARVIRAFEKLGYPPNVSNVLAELCTLENKLPQGAPTSPALSNFVAYSMDLKLTAFAQEKDLTYTRYADDLTFSGENINFEEALSEIATILRSEKFVMQRKKTRFLTEKKRKIITGISVSSGTKMTIPKSMKRELRKNVHFILSKGLAEHQRFIDSKDPSYLKRIIGQLNFWHMVEPDNEYVKKSIAALAKLY